MNKFLTFPKTKQNIEFSDLPGASAVPLKVTSKNGQSIQMSLAFQYQLKKENITDLYSSYAQAYQRSFINKASGAILDAVTQFDSTQFWEDRESVGLKMREMIDQDMQEVYARCTGVQILDYSLEANNEQKLIQTQVTR